MKPESRKIQKLLREFPFVRNILGQSMQPDGPEMCQIFDELTIKVEIADGDLLYRIGRNYGLRPDTGAIECTQGRFKGLVGKRGEYLFAVDATGRIINRVEWPNTPKERNTTGSVYGYHALWKTRSKGHLTDALFDQTEFLVWVSVNAWHEDTKDLRQHFGRCIGREAQVTIYKKPEIGFYDLHVRSSRWNNLVLTNEVFLEGLTDRDDEIAHMEGSLIELGQILWQEVYEPDIQEIIDSDERQKVSLRARYGSIDFSAGEGICGYKGIELKDDQSMIAFNQRPGANCFYVAAMFGTLPQLRKLVLTVLNYWNHVPGGRDLLVRTS